MIHQQQRLIGLLHAREARAEFEQFVTAHAGRLLRTAYVLTSDLGEAEDLVQEALFRVARRWPRVQAMDRPGAYARKVLVNLVLDKAERRRRHVRELASENWTAVLHEASDPAPDAAALSAKDELRKALQELTPRQQAVFALRYLEDLSEAEVAETLGCSVGTVKSTASRGMARLRTTMYADVEPNAAEVTYQQSTRSKEDDRST